jgi:hypothetical protein
VVTTAAQDSKASQNRKWRRRRRDRRFANKWRRAMDAPPLTEAEIEAYHASAEYARDQRDALVALWWHKRDQMLARNPTSAWPVNNRLSTVSARPRERRARGARQTAAPSSDPDAEPPAVVDVVDGEAAAA